MERGSGDRSLNHLTDEHWDFPTDLTYLHGGCPTDFADLHGYYSVGLTKTDINPLKRMEAEPGVRLPFWLYKGKLLTPKAKA